MNTAMYECQVFSQNGFASQRLTKYSKYRTLFTSNANGELIQVIVTTNLRQLHIYETLLVESRIVEHAGTHLSKEMTWDRRCRSQSKTEEEMSWDQKTTHDELTSTCILTKILCVWDT
jgi:hypothetical protein